MRVIKKVLHEKRKTTEAHIQQLQQAGEQGVRYTAMMPDIPFLMLGLISDIGWMIHLIAGVIYFCRNGFCHVLDYAALLALAGVLFGVAYVYHNIMGADKHALLLESLRVLKKGGVFVLHDNMKPQMYGDMNAFVEELRGMGFAEVQYVETAEKIFGSKQRAAMMMLGNSAMIVGRK
jgi:hypothetical protein